MKKKSMFGFVLLLMLMILSAHTVFADVDPSMYIKMPKKYATSDKYTVMFKFNGKITSVKSSKRSVASTSIYQKKVLFVTPKKTGTTKLTVKAGGKKYTCSFTYAKYKNPFKSFKVGREQCASTYNDENTSAMLFPDPGKRITVSIKLKSGYKLQKLTYNGKKIKNGAKITPKEDASDPYIRVQVKNTKTAQVLNFQCSVEAFSEGAEDGY